MAVFVSRNESSDRLLAGSAVPSIDISIIAEVARVIDGNTVDVVLADGSTERIRLLGIDTPETYGQNKAYEYGSHHRY